MPGIYTVYIHIFLKILILEKIIHKAKLLSYLDKQRSMIFSNKRSLLLY
jgi:hypothetical protein